MGLRRRILLANGINESINRQSMLRLRLDDDYSFVGARSELASFGATLFVGWTFLFVGGAIVSFSFS